MRFPFLVRSPAPTTARFAALTPRGFLAPTPARGAR